MQALPYWNQSLHSNQSNPSEVWTRDNNLLRFPKHSVQGIAELHGRRCNHHQRSSTMIRVCWFPSICSTVVGGCLVGIPLSVSAPLPTVQPKSVVKNGCCQSNCIPLIWLLNHEVVSYILLPSWFYPSQAVPIREVILINPKNSTKNWRFNDLQCSTKER